MKKIIFTVLVVFLVSGISNAQPETGIRLGNKAPELVGKSPSGETVKLSNTKGKVVLLDFWASWCGPCRRENPNVVNAYNTFKDKKFKIGDGFVVFNVSLDNNAKAWEQGIAKDKLDWPYHISDLKGWYSAHGAKYGIRQIPTNFLLDENGVILARDLKGPSLEAALRKYLK